MSKVIEQYYKDAHVMPLLLKNIPILRQSLSFGLSISSIVMV